jgi:hypothetical protein
MRDAFAHQAILAMEPAADQRAPGGKKSPFLRSA